MLDFKNPQSALEIITPITNEKKRTLATYPWLTNIYQRNSQLLEQNYFDIPCFIA